MRGPHIKTFKQDVEDTESGCPRTTLDEIPVMGMIWQDEIAKSRKKREWVAFYAGCAVGAAILAFSYIFLLRLTGGVCP